MTYRGRVVPGATGQPDQRAPVRNWLGLKASMRESRATHLRR